MPLHESYSRITSTTTATPPGEATVHSFRPKDARTSEGSKFVHLDLSKINIPRASSTVSAQSLGSVYCDQVHFLYPTTMFKPMERAPHRPDQRHSLMGGSPSSSNGAASSAPSPSAAASLVPLTPKASTDALAAVNLLPLDQCKPQATSRPATSRQSGVMSTGQNNFKTLLHNGSMGSRTPGGNSRAIEEGKKVTIGLTLTNQGVKSSKPIGTNNANFSSNVAKDKELAKNSAITSTSKQSSIEIIEYPNPELPPTKMNAPAVETTTLTPGLPIKKRPSDCKTPTDGRNPYPSNYIRMKSRPKRKPVAPPPTPHQPSSGSKKTAGIWHQGRFDTRGSPSATTPFSWETYLKLVPAKVAPKEAFTQPVRYPQNLFTLGMKLEARDPRNFNGWCLASIVGIEGLHVRLRLEGTDAMNDLYELIDSHNIRPIGSKPGELLLAPTGFTGNIANYPKFVEKTLKDAIIANPECFPETPMAPGKNLFQKGMKLEAVDRKNRDLICPATIGEVNGDDVKIIFDGWLGSFDYTCDYTSRDLFPINWCRDVGRPVQPPANWHLLLEKESQSVRSAESLPETSKVIGASLNSEKKDRSSPFASDQDSSSSSRNSGPRSTPTPGTNGAKRPRGRPKKHTGLEAKTPLTATCAAAKNNLSSTPKKDISQTNLTFNNLTDSSSTSLASEAKTAIMFSDNNLSDKVAIEGYQCQRTIPYPECLKKKADDQMPRTDLANETTDDGVVNNSSLNFSETISKASPDSQNVDESERRPGDDNSEPQRNKKQRTNEPVDAVKSNSKHPTAWTSEDVLDLIRTEESLVKYSDVFRENEIDGKAFLLLTTDILLSHMGLKIGPVLKINDLIERVKRQFDL